MLGFNFRRVFSDNSLNTRTTLGADTVFLGARLTELVVGLTDGAFGTTLALGRFRQGLVLAVTALPLDLFLAARADAGDLRQRPEPASDLGFVDFDAGVGLPRVLVFVPTVDHHD